LISPKKLCLKKSLLITADLFQLLFSNPLCRSSTPSRI